MVWHKYMAHWHKYMAHWHKYMAHWHKYMAHWHKYMAHWHKYIANGHSEPRFSGHFVTSIYTCPNLRICCMFFFFTSVSPRYFTPRL